MLALYFSFVSYSAKCSEKPLLSGALVPEPVQKLIKFSFQFPREAGIFGELENKAFQVRWADDLNQKTEKFQLYQS